MIEVKISLNSYGRGKEIWELGKIKIINDGTGSDSRGNYTVKFFDRNDSLFKKAEIKNHPRKSESIWKLLKKAMESI